MAKKESGKHFEAGWNKGFEAGYIHAIKEERKNKAIKSTPRSSSPWGGSMFGSTPRGKKW